MTSIAAGVGLEGSSSKRKEQRLAQASADRAKRDAKAVRDNYLDMLAIAREPYMRQREMHQRTAQALAGLQEGDASGVGADANMAAGLAVQGIRQGGFALPAVAKDSMEFAPSYNKGKSDKASLGTGNFGDFIASGESRGDYNAYNYFTGEDENKKLVSKINAQGEDFISFTEMTIAEVQELQSEKKVFAAGKYQVIPITLNAAIKDLGLDPNQKFSKEVQDQIFNEYLITGKKNRGALEAYLNGESDDLAAAMKDAALEFASLPVDESGNSEYGKDGFNKAQHTYEETVAALKKERARRARVVPDPKT